MTRALVTGAGKRLGRAMALELARQGHDVAVHYATSREAAESVADEIRALGREAVTLEADLLDEAQVIPLVARAAQALGGPLTTLINNASIFDYDNIQTATRLSWDRHMESNLRAPFVLTQQMAAQVPAPTMDDYDEPVAQGLVINMIDQRVHKLTPEFMTYTIAKMGLWALTRTAAQALAPRVRVNAIGPGPTLQGHRQSDSHFQNQRRATILQRGANPQDITAALVYFLNAPGVTGQLLCVDGGQHLGWQTPDVLGVE
ncbi:3-oxoacyl-(acyl-carrier-protein) reductase FabG [Roseovarius sp. EC-HK134]|uniref:3-oxoacyl-[acyl-carrier-protein] reductase FabG n=1 Tax=Roseovarius mucosus TaxID=215743 RepID=A0A1V0RNA1_9RHOB|nr:MULTISPECIES: SDR family oxidoreductase [Roseovarius]ARE83247.1 3-oxoacyl-[acyl-carrier-protein] reductase FabG [Roseovarius mucosus]VVT15206.1 3-oxoacyl-(acyl-carrier-protein) reductase FabG [Roseovarius sp. EC-HK134]VVT15737.1 3-oxoacyl-(acyl-carrier-protein) reductase FabG [Roseovarius sp. EC-SD190]